MNYLRMGAVDIRMARGQGVALSLTGSYVFYRYFR